MVAHLISVPGPEIVGGEISFLLDSAVSELSTLLKQANPRLRVPFKLLFSSGFRPKTDENRVLFLVFTSFLISVPLFSYAETEISFSIPVAAGEMYVFILQCVIFYKFRLIHNFAPKLNLDNSLIFGYAEHAFSRKAFAT